MRLRLLYDIHVELLTNIDEIMSKFTQADVLILAGDISNSTIFSYKIFVITGKHEYYKRYYNKEGYILSMLKRLSMIVIDHNFPSYKLNVFYAGCMNIWTFLL